MTRNDRTGSLPEETSVDEVVLRVRSAAGIADFYRRVVGLAVDHAEGEVRLSAGGGEPLIVLREDPDAPERQPDAAGLYHVALRVPDRRALATALRRLRERGHPLDGAADHVASEALYLSDPAGNGVEIYADRPRGEWEHTADGQVRLPGDPLDLSVFESLVPDEPGDAIHPDTVVGHVHLEVTDLERSTSFYREDLGFDLRLRKPRATFLAGGDYHHHLALNTRRGRTEPYDAEGLGLASIAFALPEADFEATVERLRRREVETVRRDDDGSCTVGRTEGVTVTDPDGIPIRFVPR